MSESLKPCPFCGKDAAKLTSLQGQFVVVCHGCGARGSMCQKEEGASRWWNTRAERTCNMETDRKYFRTEVLTWFCSECGSPIYNDMKPSFCLYCGAKVVE